MKKKTPLKNRIVQVFANAIYYQCLTVGEEVTVASLSRLYSSNNFLIFSLTTVLLF